jgi:hypothetical protein
MRKNSGWKWYFPQSGAALIRALKTAHPYEEVAYDVISLSNYVDSVGSG